MSSESSDDLRDLLALQLTPGLGPHRISTLLEHFGSATAVRRAAAADLVQVSRIGATLAQQLAESLATVDVDAELTRLQRDGVRLLAKGQPGYPSPLENVEDAPHLLYVKGTLLPQDEPAVALVGSRRCTEYGFRAAARLAGGLARAGVTVVSGLAYGIDAAAHRASLEAGGRTLAVLAGGLRRIYPRDHKGLAEEVVAHGALITESSMEQEPQSGLFPARNRIISGLCQAIVVVEAAEKSGAIITTTHAAEQGRSVLAVPGPFDAGNSAGCHELIRKGATLCRNVDDILEAMRGLDGTVAEVRSVRACRAERIEKAREPVASSGPPAWLDAEQLRLWEFLSAGPRAVDEIVQYLGLGVAQVTGMMLTLEMRRVVRRLTGNRYERW
jgi:DNA processing protein